MSFEIFIVQNSHLDIGYTDRQEKVANKQAGFIKQAVDFALAEKQDDRDADNRFKFTCEAFWSVEKYIKKYGTEGKKRLIEAVKTGYLELSVSYCHLSELLDEGHLKDSISYAKNFASENNIPLNVAMATDINGFSWAITDALYDAGVKYLLTNVNAHHGGSPFDGPLFPFYWQSPKGNKILVWSGCIYTMANVCGLIPYYVPQGVNEFVGTRITDDVKVLDLSYAEKQVDDMLDKLKKYGYKYNFIPIAGSGHHNDNSAVTDTYCELIKEWNKKHGEKIHIRTATVDEYFKYLEKNAGDIPTFSGEWTDWWTDGTISTPSEVRLFRNAQRNKRIIEMLDPNKEVISDEKLDDITKNLIQYAEHTWGNTSSYWTPAELVVLQSDLRKSKFAIDADVLVSTALDDVLAHYGEVIQTDTKHQTFEYKVINPLNEPKKCVVALPTEYWESQYSKWGFKCTDLYGNTYKVQQYPVPMQTMNVVEVELEPKEVRILKLEPLSEKPEEVDLGLENGVFENEWYKLEWNSNSGISSLISKDTGRELIDKSAQLLGAPVYQVFESLNHISGMWEFEHSETKVENKISYGQLISFKIVEQGDIYTTYKADFTVDGATYYNVLYKFYNNLPQIEVTVRMAKEMVIKPEGMYTAFPLAINDGKWYLDKPGVCVMPGRDQLPGTCCDYYSVVHGAVLAGSDDGIALTILDAPMVTIGGLKLYDFTKTIEPTGILYSWLCNNKWETNFRAECGGFYEMRYVIEYSKEFKDTQKSVAVVKNNSYNAIGIRL